MKPSGRLRIFFCLSLIVGILTAHPMGNFSISHYAKFETAARGMELTYALDLAEIPTFELLRDWKLERTSDTAQLQGKALEQARTWAANLAITVDGKPVQGVVKSAEYVIADGAGNLPVMRITAKVAIDAAGGRVEYEDRNFAERAGWKEIVIAGTAIAKASHSAKDISNGLTAYPEDPTVAPPQDLRARFEWTPTVVPVAVVQPKSVIIEPIPQPKPTIRSSQPQASPAVQSSQPGVVQKGDYLSELLRKGDLSLSMILVGLLAAFGFGAMHALSPGHGKTIVAAYLVGSRGTMKHAALLGAMVTVTHTASVFALGLGTLFLSRYIVPDKIYPILSAFSGLMIVFIGGSMFYRRLKVAVAQSRIHTHDHSDHDQEHRHDHEHARAVAGSLTHRHDDENAHTVAAVAAPRQMAALRQSHVEGEAKAQTPDHEHSHGPGTLHSHDGHARNQTSSHDNGESHEAGKAHSSTYNGHTHDHSHEDGHRHDAGKAHTHPNGHKHDHAHAKGHSHSHDGSDHHHHHGPSGHTHHVEGEVTMGNLVGLAISGGLVPCPSALVLLLSAIAIGRIGLGLALLTAFSLGLSLVLMAIGAMVLYAKHLLPDRPSVTQSPFFKMVPVISAGVITVVGIVMTAVALGWVNFTIG